MKAMYKALVIVEGARLFNLPVLMAELSRFESEYMEYESLMETSDRLDNKEPRKEEMSSTSEAVFLTAEAKLEKLMVDYLALVKVQSRLSFLGWIYRPLFLTKNPKYDYLRTRLKMKFGK